MPVISTPSWQINVTLCGKLLQFFCIAGTQTVSKNSNWRHHFGICFSLVEELLHSFRTLGEHFCFVLLPPGKRSFLGGGVFSCEALFSVASCHCKLGWLVTLRHPSIPPVRLPQDLNIISNQLKQLWDFEQLVFRKETLLAWCDHWDWAVPATYVTEAQALIVRANHYLNLTHPSQVQNQFLFLQLLSTLHWGWRVDFIGGVCFVRDNDRPPPSHCVPLESLNLNCVQSLSLHKNLDWERYLFEMGGRNWWSLIFSVWQSF